LGACPRACDGRDVNRSLESNRGVGVEGQRGLTREEGSRCSRHGRKFDAAVSCSDTLPYLRFHGLGTGLTSDVVFGATVHVGGRKVGEGEMALDQLACTYVCEYSSFLRGGVGVCRTAMELEPTSTARRCPQKCANCCRVCLGQGRSEEQAIPRAIKQFPSNSKESNRPVQTHIFCSRLQGPRVCLANIRWRRNAKRENPRMVLRPWAGHLLIGCSRAWQETGR
jgi:hypothetical protein